ncbi:MAG: ABC transporter permease [Phycisphaerae bacterium]|nr:ABC transporter permease [Phycisphaerae bacterium]
MKALTALATRLDNAANPIVVKELRQAVQGRFVSGLLFFFLIVQLLTLGSFVLFSEHVTTNFESGRDAFNFLLGILLGTCIFFLPAYVGLRLAAERSGSNPDLLFVSTLTPRQIIMGKSVASLILVLLIYSTCMPFMAFTYLLRGIDLPSIFILLAMCFLAIAVGLHLAIFAACIPCGRGSRFLNALLTFGALVALFSSTLGAATGMIQSGVGSWINSTEFWAGAVSLVVLAAGAVGLLVILSLAMIMPPSANRIMPLRIYLTAVWLIVAVLAWYWAGQTGDVEFLESWLVGSVILSGAGVLGSVSERDSHGPRLARSIPRNPLLRTGSFLFFTGAASGILWALLVAIVSFLPFWAFTGCLPATVRRPPDPDLLFGAFVFSCYCFAYALTASVIKRAFLRDSVLVPYASTIALLLVVGGSILPVLIGYFINYQSWYGHDFFSYWLLGNPFAVLFSKPEYIRDAAVFAGGWAIVALAVNVPWLLGQVTAFRPAVPLPPAKPPEIVTPAHA